MTTSESQLEYQPELELVRDQLEPVSPAEDFKGYLLEAAKDNRWMAILEPPTDFRNVDPRKSQVLQNALQILGGVSIAIQTMYQGCYEWRGVPLLKSDSKRTQYMNQKDNPNVYSLVAFKGHKGLFAGKRVCEAAKFMKIPDVVIEQARRKFVDFSSMADYQSSIPRFISGDLGFSVKNIAYCSDATAIKFDKKGRVETLGIYIRESESVLIAYYQFLWDRSLVRLLNYSRNRWESDSTINWICESDYTLNQDGILRSSNGKTSDTSLEERLIAATSSLPLVHHVDGVEVSTK